MGTEEEKKKKHLIAPESEESGSDPPSVAHKWSTRMYDFNTIFEDSIQSFMPPLFSVQSSSVVTLQRNKNQAPKPAHVDPNWRLRDDLNCDLRRKHETVACSCEGWRDAWAESVSLCTWADCVTITITFIDPVHAFWHSYWAFKGVFHVIFFHSQFTVLALERMTNAGWSFASCSMCILWLKRLLTILKGLCNASIGECNALYNWILHKTPHTRGWKWICTISEFTSSYYILLIELPVNRSSDCSCVSHKLPYLKNLMSPYSSVVCTQVQVKFQEWDAPTSCHNVK